MDDFVQPTQIRQAHTAFHNLGHSASDTFVNAQCSMNWCIFILFTVLILQV
jgi:hypothetical protein